VRAIYERLGSTRLAELEVDAVRTRPVPSRLVARLAREDGEHAGRLTPRERECLVLLAAGMRRQEIADELGIAHETVRSHLSRAYLELGVHRQIDAVNAFLDDAA
jgi:DNA-binding CsgD family transcriptional regulator